MGAYAATAGCLVWIEGTLFLIMVIMFLPGQQAGFTLVRDSSNQMVNVFHVVALPLPHTSSPPSCPTHPFPGPALHAEVGDTIVFVLKNNAPFPVNAEPGGILSAPSAAANPGEVITYR